MYAIVLYIIYIYIYILWTAEESAVQQQTDQWSGPLPSAALKTAAAAAAAAAANSNGPGIVCCCGAV